MLFRSLASIGGRAQYMGGTKTSIGSDGTVQVQGAWQTAFSALDRYDAGLAGYDDDYGDDDSEGGEGSVDDSIGDVSEIDEEEEEKRNREDYDSDAERKAKRRKLLFGMSLFLL